MEMYNKHYAELGIQPIELMEAILTPEEFRGYLKGNCIKYSMRCGHKDESEKEIAKFKVYSQWLANLTSMGNFRGK